MTDDDKRHVNMALWHARESVLRATTGDEENADYHLQASRESLALVSPDASRSARTPEQVIVACTEFCDAAGVVVA